MAFLKKKQIIKEESLTSGSRNHSSRSARSGKTDMFGILLYPHITEKTAQMVHNQTYGFVIADSANKKAVQEAVEKRYGVHVTDVRVISNQGKEIRRGKQIGWKHGIKKAMVKIKQGETIEIE